MVPWETSAFYLWQTRKKSVIKSAFAEQAASWVPSQDKKSNALLLSHSILPGSCSTVACSRAF